MYENCRGNKYFLINLDTEVRNNDSITKIWLCKVMSEKREWQVTKSLPLNPPLDKYKTTCCINHSGSSDSMETIEMVLHYIEKNGLRYTTFAGDRHSNFYASVCEALTCYSYEVEKKNVLVELIETAFREYKRKMKGIRLAEGKSISGNVSRNVK